jgi:hypothetical protein
MLGLSVNVYLESIFSVPDIQRQLPGELIACRETLYIPFIRFKMPETNDRTIYAHNGESQDYPTLLGSKRPDNP